MPQGNTGDFKRDLITSPNSKSSQLLLEDIKKSANRPIALYKLGIGLHIYADTFSHQDFKGFYDSYNDVYLLTGVDESSNIMILINKIKRRLKNKFLDIPPVGHGQALTNPDIPYANWSYKRPGGEIIVVNNLKERFIPAIKNIHDFLCVYLEENPSFKDNDVELKAYDFYKEKLIELLTFQGNSDERHQNWLDKVNNNYFEFGDFDEVDTQLNYDKRNWFRRAVKAIEDRGFKNKAYNFHSFYKKDNFEQSDWVMFMRAASEHKYKIIHEILPACGVDAG